MESKKTKNRRISKAKTDSQKVTTPSKKVEKQEVYPNSTAVLKIFEQGIQTTKQYWKGKKLIPTTYSTVIRRMNWNQDTVQNFSSEENRVPTVTAGQWKKLSKYARLVVRASYFANGNEFELTVLGNSEELGDKITEYQVRTKVNPNTCKAY